MPHPARFNPSHQHMCPRVFVCAGFCVQPAAWFAATEPDGGAASFLPALITDTQPTSSAATSAATASGADGGDGDLRIAWQYRKYLQTAQKQREQEQAEAAAAERQAKLKAAAGGGGAGGSGRTAAEKAVSAGIAKQWCHSYDLTRSMDTGLVTQHGLVSACTLPHTHTQTHTYKHETTSKSKAALGGVASHPCSFHGRACVVHVCVVCLHA